MTRRTKVLILGAGTAGLTALKEAQRYTDDIMLVNAGPYGTTCARVGCMPSKALLEVAHAVGRRDWLAQVGVGGTDALAVDLPMVMAHVRVLRDRFIAGPIELAKSLGECSIHGKATFLDPHTVDVEGVRIQAETIIIATGTRPFVPDSWRAFGSRVVTSDEVFELKAPKRRVGVVGLGPIGLELGQAFAQLGCEVHAFTRGPHVAGLRDEEVNASLVEVLTKQMTVITEADVSLHEGGDHIIVEGGNHRAEVDWVLASLGRRPNIEGLGLECLGVEARQWSSDTTPMTGRLRALASSATSTTTSLTPLLEKMINESSAPKTKLRMMTAPSPSTCSKNMAWRWPLAPTTLV